MIIDVITIFPEMFDGPMSASIIGSARERGLIELRVHDLRKWTHDRHRTVDDYPYGGGPGMVMKPEPLFAAIESVSALSEEPPYVVVFTPAGSRFDQRRAHMLADKRRLLLVCGRYEGIDERVMTLADLELSIGDYILTGGELPAMVVIDAVARLLPGALGDDASSMEESFEHGLLEYPHYTRPALFRGSTVPEVLLSGDHARIAQWRRREAIRRTALRRPDLLQSADLTDDERAWCRELLGSHGSDGEGCR